MMKKVRVLDVWPEKDTWTRFADLCGISKGRLSAIMQYDELPFSGKRPTHFSALRAREWIAEMGSIPNEIIICLGSQTIEAVGCAPQKKNTVFTFELGGGVHMGVYIARPSAKAMRPRERQSVKRILSSIVAVCPVPVTVESAKTCLRVVRGIGDDNISFWTRKVLTEIEQKLRDSKPVDGYDLSQLMQCYANDVQFLSKEN